MFFQYYTNRIHSDTHSGNFLFFNIKKGGYFHYRIYGVDYYLENLGFLWVIWDYDLSITVEKAIKRFHKSGKRTDDYYKIIKFYISESNNGYNSKSGIDKNKKLADIVISLYQSLYLFKYKEYNLKNIREFIYDVPSKLSEINIDGKYLFLKSLPKKETVINNKPYIIKKNKLFKT